MIWNDMEVSVSSRGYSQLSSSRHGWKWRLVLKTMMTWGSPILRNLHISLIFLGKGYITISFFLWTSFFWRWQPKYAILMPMVFTQCHKSYFWDGTSRDLQSWWVMVGCERLLAPAYYKEVMNLFNICIYIYTYIYMWEIKVGTIYIYTQRMFNIFHQVTTSLWLQHCQT